MLYALIGAIDALLLFSGVHDRQICCFRGFSDQAGSGTGRR
jgi:hypothetical protein